VMDNYGTHKVTKVRTWLARHPRYHVHFTPTSGSWLNLVERLFAEVTERCVRRGSHTHQARCFLDPKVISEVLVHFSVRGPR
jgi:transposase